MSNTEQKELYAISKKELHEAVIKLLCQLPVEPYGRVAIWMIDELRSCPIVEKENAEKENVEHKNEKK